jgi:GNAT superfamily N-acetyltransferase
LTLTITIEPFLDALPELRPLFDRQWAELANHKDIPLNPDYDFYTAADHTGLLVTYIARLEGAVVGYALFIMRAHPHYKAHGWAMCDIIWVDTNHRGRRIGGRMFDFVETDLKRREVSVIHMRTKVDHHELAAMLESRGYRMVEHGYERRI